MEINDNLHILKFPLAIFFTTILLIIAGCEKDSGRLIFEDRDFANNEKDVSCSFCHDDGEKFNGTATKTIFNIEGKTYTSIESVINQVMIKKYTEGQPIDINSQEMQDLTAYVKKIAKK